MKDVRVICQLERMKPFESMMPDAPIVGDIITHGPKHYEVYMRRILLTSDGKFHSFTVQAKIVKMKSDVVVDPKPSRSTKGHLEVKGKTD